jgi:hypothetical protein
VPQTAPVGHYSPNIPKGQEEAHPGRRALHPEPFVDLLLTPFYHALPSRGHACMHFIPICH